MWGFHEPQMVLVGGFGVFFFSTKNWKGKVKEKAGENYLYKCHIK